MYIQKYIRTLTCDVNLYEMDDFNIIYIYKYQCLAVCAACAYA